MLSIIVSIYNRAHLLKWCLEAVKEQDWLLAYNLETEVNVLDDGSTDNLDEVLSENSLFFKHVNKWVWDPKKSRVSRAFNCPAECYNILVKLSRGPFILKTDPEMVILDKTFLSMALARALDTPAIVMPFPYHCYAFEVKSLEDIRNNYRQFTYPTHITEQNAPYEMVYYQAVFKKEDYLNLGGVDERFCGGVGSEDVHFLNWWKKKYEADNFVPLINSSCVHLFHGGMANGPMGVPQHLYPWVDSNANLRRALENTRPNEGQEWGRLYDFITLTRWVRGHKIIDEGPINEYINCDS
jgi:glycosyltransferase involved in cell wall biosynthesis